MRNCTNSFQKMFGCKKIADRDILNKKFNREWLVPIEICKVRNRKRIRVN